jgi:hypothetical protein
VTELESFFDHNAEAEGDSTEQHCCAQNNGENIGNSKPVAESQNQNAGDGENGGKHLVGLDELEHFVSFRLGITGAFLVTQV